MKYFASWAQIRKVSDEEQVIEAIASTASPDDQNDIVETLAMKDALPDYMQYPALREMHELKAVGTVLSAEVVEGDIEVDGKVLHNPVKVIAKVSDTDVWRKIKDGVYRGLSIGAKAHKWVMDTVNGRTVRRITKLALVEISVVDRPSNRDAKILLWKGVSMKDPSKVIATIQDMRNQAELTGDTEGAALLTNAIALIMQAQGNVEEEQPPVATPPEGGEGGESGKTEPPAEEKIQKQARVDTGKAVHGVIKSLAAFLAGGGDATGQAIAKCYDAPDEMRKAAEAELQKVSSTIAQSIDPVLQIVKALDARMAGVDARLEKIEQLPASGGPVTRSEKQMAGQGLGSSAQTATDDLKKRSDLAARVNELRKLSMTEPNPLMRADYTRQLILAEQQLSVK